MLEPTAPAPMITMSAVRGIMTSSMGGPEMAPQSPRMLGGAPAKPWHPRQMVQSCQPTSPEKGSPMREAVVVASSRTPLAKSFRGSFNLTRPDDLAAHVIKDVLGKAPRLDPAEV